jgi:hypothetical protein
MTGLAVGVLVVAVSGVAPSGGTVAVPELPVKIFVFGPWGQGSWDLEIDGRGAVRTDAGSGSGIVRRLKASERRDLALVLARLPVTRRRYEFGAWPIDACTVFTLTVGSGKSTRRYTVTDALDAARGQSELQRILEALWHLRTLIKSDDAAWPPEPIRSSGKRRRTRG